MKAIIPLLLLVLALQSTTYLPNGNGTLVILLQTVNATSGEKSQSLYYIKWGQNNVYITSKTGQSQKLVIAKSLTFLSHINGLDKG